jgi:uncharacterized protein YbaR (Trm112 family)
VIKRELLDILVCPLGKQPLREEGEYLVCTRCGARYPVKDDIPILLVDRAELPEGVGSVEELACYPKEEKDRKS